MVKHPKDVFGGANMAEEKKPRTSGSEFWVGKIRHNLDGCTEEEKTQIEKLSGQVFDLRGSLLWLLQGRNIVPTERNMAVGDKSKAGDFVKQLDTHLKALQTAGTKITADYVQVCIEKNIQAPGVKKLVSEHYFPPKVEPVYVAPPVIAPLPDFKWTA
jgi:hypothetical protein